MLRVVRKNKLEKKKETHSGGYSNPQSESTDSTSPSSDCTITIPDSDGSLGQSDNDAESNPSQIQTDGKQPEPYPITDKDQPPSVLVLYSIQTAAEEIKEINELLVCGLSEFNVSVDSLDTVGPKEICKEWIEKELRGREAVLLVCNRQFHEEWKSDNDEGELRIGSIVRVRDHFLYS